MGHPNVKKHKAMHCGYKKKPSQKAINALLDMYAGIVDVIPTGTQLKLEL